MGKYIRKGKTKKAGEVVAVLDVSSFGVLTRAKTLALQKSTSGGGGGGGGGSGDGGCYLQLRSRRLEKPLVGFEKKRRKHPLKESNRSLRVREMKGQSWNSGDGEGEEEKKEETQNEANNNGSCEGENLLEGRNTRESTPCNLIRDADNIQTSSSSIRPNNASEANGGGPHSPQLVIPTEQELSRVFRTNEKQQQKEFMEKYNFDVVNDKPLPGRYKWVKIDD